MIIGITGKYFGILEKGLGVLEKGCVSSAIFLDVISKQKVRYAWSVYVPPNLLFSSAIAYSNHNSTVPLFPPEVSPGIL